MQAPECGAVAARNVAFSRPLLKLAINWSLTSLMPGLSQADCLPADRPMGSRPKDEFHRLSVTVLGRQAASDTGTG